MNAKEEILERRRLLLQGKQLGYERQRQIMLDAEAELIDAESEICRVTGKYGANTRLSFEQGRTPQP